MHPEHPWERRRPASESPTVQTRDAAIWMDGICSCLSLCQLVCEAVPSGAATSILHSSFGLSLLLLYRAIALATTNSPRPYHYFNNTQRLFLVTRRFLS